MKVYIVYKQDRWDEVAKKKVELREQEIREAKTRILEQERIKEEG